MLALKCVLFCCCSCRTLQRQEEAREAALKAFHDNIAARAVQAGAAAVAENRSRAEREERLMAASEAKAQAEAGVGLCNGWRPGDMAV
jgi:hypothetical protein